MQILSLLLFIIWKKLETLQIFTETQKFQNLFFGKISKEDGIERFWGYILLPS